MAKIYIVTFASHFTGGTEVSHQLCHSLRNNGFDAYIYYINIQNGVDPVHELFKTYNICIANSFIDAEDNFLIVPEILTNIIFTVKYAKKIIWWLSVDNYYNNLFARLESNRSGATKLLNIAQADKIDCYHFTQSHYAMEHLLFHGVDTKRIFMVTDYINKRYMPPADSEFISEGRESVCAFAPRRGLEFVEMLRDYGANLSDRIVFVPVENMEPNEVPLFMRLARVFIDFGFHPGMDRMPREAAVNGCCVITNTDGAARYDQDVPIPGEYKIESSVDNLSRIYDLIRSCILHYDEHIKNFAGYRQFIRAQETNFEKEVVECFTQLTSSL